MPPLKRLDGCPPRPKAPLFTLWVYFQHYTALSGVWGSCTNPFPVHSCSWLPCLPCVRQHKIGCCSFLLWLSLRETNFLKSFLFILFPAFCHWVEYVRLAIWSHSFLLELLPASPWLPFSRSLVLPVGCVLRSFQWLSEAGKLVWPQSLSGPGMRLWPCVILSS